MVVPSPIDNDEEINFEGEESLIVMVPDETNAMQGIHFPPQAGLDLAVSTASFVVDYVPDGGHDAHTAPCYEFPAEAKTALEYAASIWAATIYSSVPTTIRACWTDSPKTFLGFYHHRIGSLEFSWGTSERYSIYEIACQCPTWG